MTEELSPKEYARLTTLYEVSVPLTVGRATIAWNTLSGAFFGFFQTLSGLSDDMAKATFFAIASDRSQRDIVSNLIEIKLRKAHPKLAKEAQTLVGKANALAGKRNDVLHVVFVNALDPATVAQMHERGHLKGKAGDELLDAIHKLTMDCLDLSLEAASIRSKIFNVTRGNTLTPGMVAVAKALLEQTLQRTPEELASQGEYGLLGDQPTSEPSPAPDERGHPRTE